MNVIGMFLLQVCTIEKECPVPLCSMEIIKALLKNSVDFVSLRLMENLSMRRILAAALFTLLPVTSLAETRLVFCYDPYPPYTFGSEGTPEGGLKVKLLDAVMEQIEGLSADVVLLPWKRCQAQAKAGEVDGILPLFESAERGTYLAFTRGTFLQTSGFFYHRARFPEGLSWSGDVEELAKLRLGMIAGSIIDNDMEAAFSGNNEILRARNGKALVQLLAKQRVDLIALDAAVGRYEIASAGLADKLDAVEQPISGRESHFGLSKSSGADRHLDAFNQAIQALNASGQIDKILLDTNYP